MRGCVLYTLVTFKKLKNENESWLVFVDFKINFEGGGKGKMLSFALSLDYSVKKSNKGQLSDLKSTGTRIALHFVLLCFRLPNPAKRMY